jgi:hypothetical protein
MVPSLTIILFLALLFVAVGFIAGALIVLARNEYEKNHTPNPQGDSKPIHENESLHLWMDPKTGRLQGVWNGNAITHPKHLPADERRQLAALLAEWITALSEDPVPPAPPATPASEQAASIPPVRTEAPARPAPPTAPAAKPAAAKPDRPAPEPMATSIVAQINQILQEQIEGSALQARSIRLAEDLKDGVIVYVGLERYRGIDTVEDPEVRAAIRTAAAEWERRSETTSR